jgi:hypothetical protein
MDENDDLMDLPTVWQAEGACLILPTDERPAALVVPAIGKLPPGLKRDLLVSMSRVSFEMYRLRQEADRLAVEARQAGASWGLLGVASGLSERQARRRWGGDVS